MGVTKYESVTDIALFEHAVREELNAGTLLGYPVVTTTQLPTNINTATSGAAVNNGAYLFFADFADVIIGDTLNVLVDASDVASYADGNGNAVSASGGAPLCSGLSVPAGAGSAFPTNIWSATATSNTATATSGSVAIILANTSQISIRTSNNTASLVRWMAIGN